MLLGVGCPGAAFAGDFGYNGTCYNTLNAAISAAAADPTGTILIKPGTYTLNNVITWTDDHTVRAGNATCDAPEVGGAVTLIAAANKRAFKVSAGHSLTMYGVSLQGGAPNSGLGGGTIVVDAGSSLFMDDGTLSGGTTTAANGGCLAAATGSLVGLERVTVSDCTADGDGGGISIAAGGQLYLEDVDVRYNTAASGGGVRADGADVWIFGTSEVQNNVATSEGGGVYLVADSGAATLTILDEAQVHSNDAEVRGGGLAMSASLYDATVEILDNSSFDGNFAPIGAGISEMQDVGDALLTLRDEVYFFQNGNFGVGGISATSGGAIYIGGGSTELWDEVHIGTNSAFEGGGVYVDTGGELIISGTQTTALTGNLPDVEFGVWFQGNEAAENGAGSAIFADGGMVTAWDLRLSAAAGWSPAGAVALINGSTFVAIRSHFNDNAGDVFHVHSGSSLSVTAGYNVEAGCDTFGGGYGFNRYCSEIGWNKGYLLVASGAGTEVEFAGTALLFNDLNSLTEVAVVVEDGADVAFITNLVGHNTTFDSADPMLVRVEDGGDFVAKQNTFADEALPVVYQAGATGDFRRNAAYDAGATTVAVEVDAAATVTGAENIGDWSGSIASAFLNGTAPGWVTTGRGDFHLELASAAVDICSTDGGFDIEGTIRPQPAAEWDAGAIELAQP